MGHNSKVEENIYLLGLLGQRVAEIADQPSECPQSAGKELAWRDLASATASGLRFRA
jgi:hypothetical protein